MNLINLLMLLITFCFVVWAAMQLMNAFAIPEPIRRVVLVLVVALALLALANTIGYFGPVVPLRLR